MTFRAGRYLQGTDGDHASQYLYFFSQDSFFDQWFNGLIFDQIHWSPQGIFQFLGDSDNVKKAEIIRKLDENVNVAVRTQLSPYYRAKQSSTLGTVPGQDGNYPLLDISDRGNCLLFH